MAENESDVELGNSEAASRPQAVADESDSTAPQVPVAEYGHFRLAEEMGAYPASAIFRCFSTLNALNILYYQAELCILEKELEESAALDRQSPDAFRRQYFQHFMLLSYGVTEAGTKLGSDNRQWRAIQRMRQVLKEYNHAIFMQSRLNNMAKPSEGDLNYLRDWMLDDGNNGCVELLGDDRYVWGDTSMKDMVGIYAREYEDAISTWVTERALLWYEWAIGRHFQRKGPPGTWLADTSIYSRRSVYHLVSVLAIGAASIFPIVSVIALSAIRGKTQMQLLFMGLFTILFCTVFGLLTGARKTELLAASAAFAAVQVVFISGDSCCNSP